MVRLALEQFLDPRVLPVREPELAVDRLFGNGAQKVILAVAVDVTAARRSDRRYLTCGPAGAFTVAR